MFMSDGLDGRFIWRAISSATKAYSSGVLHRNKKDKCYRYVCVCWKILNLRAHIPWSSWLTVLECVQLVGVVLQVPMHLMMVQRMAMVVMVMVAQRVAARVIVVTNGACVQHRRLLVGRHHRWTVVAAVRMVVVVSGRCFGRVQRRCGLAGQIGEQLFAADVATVFLAQPIGHFARSSLVTATDGCFVCSLKTITRF